MKQKHRVMEVIVKILLIHNQSILNQKESRKMNKVENRGAWLVQSVEHENLDLRFINLTPTLGWRLTKNKIF